MPYSIVEGIYKSIMKSIVILVLMVALASADQFVPIPKTPYGFTFGAADGQFHIEAFLDLLCIMVLRQVPTAETHTMP
jgi:hypothetical protein